MEASKPKWVNSISNIINSLRFPINFMYFFYFCWMMNLMCQKRYLYVSCVRTEAIALYRDNSSVVVVVVVADIRTRLEFLFMYVFSSKMTSSYDAPLACRWLLSLINFLKLTLNWRTFLLYHYINIISHSVYRNAVVYGLIQVYTKTPKQKR